MHTGRLKPLDTTARAGRIRFLAVVFGGGLRCSKHRALVIP